MRILDKAVQMNEEFKPVMLITLELPLMMEYFSVHNAEFIEAFNEANKAYDDQQKVEK